MCREELRREKSQHESWVEEKKQASGGFFSRLFSRSSGSTNTEEQVGSCLFPQVACSVR